MNKGIGYAIGLALTAVGVGIPSAALAAGNDISQINAAPAHRIEAEGYATWEHGDIYATGVDPFGGVVERLRESVPVSAFDSGEAQWNASNELAARESRSLDASRTAQWAGVPPFESAEALWDASIRETERVERLSVDGNVDGAAIGFDPYSGIVEPTPPWQPVVAAAVAPANTFGLTPVEPSALGLDEYGYLADEVSRPAVEGQESPDLAAYGFDPYGGNVEPGPGVSR